MERLKELLENTSREIWIIIGLVLALIGAAFLLLRQPQPVNDATMMAETVMASSQSMQMTENGQTATTSATATMYVDVKGAVEQPGLKKVDQTMRVIDAVQLAGGFAGNADEKQVNLAQRLVDQQVVYIPKRGEKVDAAMNQAGAPASSGATGTSQAPQVNLNTADVTELQQLDGVGEKKAAKIIEYREVHGQFQSIEELKEVSGFGDKTLERLRPQLAV